MADEDKKEDKDAKEGEGAAAAPAKSGSKKMVLIIVGVVVLLAAIGVPVAFLALKKEAPVVGEADKDAAHGEASLTPEGADDEDALEEDEERLGALFPLETFVVNLSGGRYVRTQMQLEFVERDVPKRFYGKIVPVRDAVLTLLAAKSASDIESPTGREKLKSEVKDLINEMMRKEEVKKVYFTQFIVQ